MLSEKIKGGKIDRKIKKSEKLRKRIPKKNFMFTKDFSSINPIFSMSDSKKII